MTHLRINERPICTELDSDGSIQAAHPALYEGLQIFSEKCDLGRSQFDRKVYDSQNRIRLLWVEARMVLGIRMGAAYGS